MPTLQRDWMKKLYNGDIWDGFRPSTAGGAVQGWNGDHPALSRLASAPGSKLIIDVGVWKGQSTISMAYALKSAGLDGCVIAVDTFLGSSEHWHSGNDYFSRQQGRPDLFQTFMSNVYNAGVSDYVIPMPQTSTTAASILRRLEFAASIVHVDAAHEYSDVLRDVEEYWSILAPGGILVGDDYHQTWPGVIRAAGEFSARMLRPLLIEGPKWILRKDFTQLGTDPEMRFR